MGYDSKSILSDIHKSDPLPSKGKITKLSKTNNINKSLDAALSPEERDAALLLYNIITKIFGVDCKKPFYDPEKDAMKSDALKSLSEAEELGSLTPIDLMYVKISSQFIKDYDDLDYVYANKLLQFYGYNLDGLYKNLGIVPNRELKTSASMTKAYLTDTKGKMRFIRSANHMMQVKEKKTGDYYFNGFGKDGKLDLSKLFESFSKVFPELAENFLKRPFNDDVKTGVDPYVINAFVGLLNKSIKLNGRSFALRPIAIPKDKQIPEKEKSLSKSNVMLDKFMQTKVGKFLTNMVQKTMYGSAVSQVARKLTEALEINDNILRAISEEHPEFAGKTLKDLENDWKTPHCRDMDARDNKVLLDFSNKVKNGDDFKKYWDNTEDINELLDSISRQLYYATNKKLYLYTWDKNQNWLCLKNDDKYSKYVSDVEYDNRMEDEVDMEAFESNRRASGIDDLIYEYNNSHYGDTTGNQFELEHPSLKDINELSRVVDVVASAVPFKQIKLSDELGVCIPDRNDIETFKELQAELKGNFPEACRNEVYESLRKMLSRNNAVESITSVAERMREILKKSC